MGRADKMLKALKASRLDGTYDAQMRQLIRTDLLILDGTHASLLRASDMGCLDDARLIDESHDEAQALCSDDLEGVHRWRRPRRSAQRVVHDIIIGFADDPLDGQGPRWPAACEDRDDRVV